MARDLNEETGSDKEIDPDKVNMDMAMDQLDDEEKEDKAILEERKKKKAEEEAWLSWYRDPKNDYETFNPKKKFGQLESADEWTYDQITSSYNVNLTGDHYIKFIGDKLPKKEDGMGKWFIRPHHVETLTSHVQSVNDDVLNTWYFSNYNCEPEKQKTPELEVAMKSLEEHMQTMKLQLRTYQMEKGIWNPD